jgi:hypothetical protein
MAQDLATEFPGVPRDKLEEIVSEEIVRARGCAYWRGKDGKE